MQRSFCRFPAENPHLPQLLINVRARNDEGVRPAKSKGASCHSGVHSKISKGTLRCSGVREPYKNIILPQFRASDAHEVAKGFSQREILRFATVLNVRRARSDEKVIS